MSITILQTKLHMPGSSPREGSTFHVSRQRLLHKLNAGLASKLITVCAPAGFGKSTLLGAWVMRNARLGEVAWLSLDEGDNDPIRFWAHFVAALQRVDATIGATTMALLQSPQLLPPETLLTALLNDLNACPTDVIFVLDDYHLVNAAAIHKGLLFLLDHKPPQLHVVVSSRTDPPWPLARWRGQNQLTEVRADDLRFTLAEATTFLQEVMGLALSPAEILALDKRTEGWVAGLQLVALSLRGVTDSTRFISAFSGTNRYIVDYLVEEVLARQSEDVQRFLLQTSILERLCGSLCDAVMAHSDSSSFDSQELLEQLDHDNLFLIALDEERTWYRYHHLFGEVLQHRLRRSHASSISLLHRRASAWFQQRGLIAEAIHHALEATDFEQAATLIEQIGIAHFAQPTIQYSLSQWMLTLPPAVLHSRPRLCLTLALIQSVNTNFPSALQWVKDAEAAFSRSRPHHGVDGTPELAAQGDIDNDPSAIRGEIATMYTLVAAYQPDRAPEEVIALSEQALALLGPDQPTFRCIAAMARGLASLKLGNIVAAESCLAEAMRAARAADNLYLIGLSATNHVTTQRMQGSLPRALATCQEALAWASQRGVAEIPIYAGSYANLAELYRERNELELAHQYATRAVALSDQALEPGMGLLNRVVLVRVKHARREWMAMWELLDQIAILIEQYPYVVHVDLLAAMKAQFRIAEAADTGNVDALATALAWANGAAWEEGELLAASRFLDYIYMYEHRRIARVQVFLAWARMHGDRHLAEEALAYIKRQLPIAQAAGTRWFEVKIWLLQALALHMLGDAAHSHLALHQALRLAQPQGFVRVFVDEGEVLRRRLVDASQEITEPHLLAYAEQLLDSFPLYDPRPSVATTTSPSLVEQLTERELEILRLVNDGLSNREMATTLIVSLGTVKKHLNNIFGKLGVSSRTQALVTARKLHLV